MKGWAGALVGLGLLLLITAWLLPVTISVPETRYSSVLTEVVPTGGVNEVVNLQKLQVQMMIWHAGLIAFLAGCVLAGAGAVADRLSFTAADRVAPVAPDEAPSQPLVAGAGGAPATREDTQFQPMSDGDKYAFYAIGALIAVFMLVALIYNFARPTTPAPNAVDLSNAEAIADNLEMTADNLEALANATVPNRP